MYRRFTAAIPPQTQEGVHHETQITLPPRIAALLIALVLTGSARAEFAAATAALGLSLGYMAEMMMACVRGDTPACIGALGGAVTPDRSGDPSMKNKPSQLDTACRKLGTARILAGSTRQM